MGKAEYSGEFKEGKRSGNGIMKWGNGEEYEGQWQDDNFVILTEHYTRFCVPGQQGTAYPPNNLPPSSIFRRMRGATAHS